MQEKTKTFWRIFFVFAGLWNVGIANYFILNLSVGMEIITGFNTQEPHTLYVFFLFWFCIAAFGLAFWQVAYDLRHNRAFLYLAIIGKSLICASFTYGYLKNLATMLTVWIGIGDVLWAAFFVVFLYHSRENALKNL